MLLSQEVNITRLAMHFVFKQGQVSIPDSVAARSFEHRLHPFLYLPELERMNTLLRNQLKFHKQKVISAAFNLHT